MVVETYSKGVLLPHGGARLNARRPSTALSYKDCSNLASAAVIAHKIHHPFNRFITTLWERAGIDPFECVKATGRFIKYAGDWMRCHGRKLIWMWVQERGDWNGAHVHMLLHVPPDLITGFRPMHMRWVKQIIPGKYQKGVSQMDTIGSPMAPLHSPDYYRSLLMAKVHYLLKCAPKEFEVQLGMDQWRTPHSAYWGRRCTVYGKRLAIWQGWNQAA